MLFVDKQNTYYLNVENIEFANKNTYLITNVNSITMHQDTILVDKMLYIKEGFINNSTDTIENKGIEIIDAKHKYLTPVLISFSSLVLDI